MRNIEVDLEELMDIVSENPGYNDVEELLRDKISSRDVSDYIENNFTDKQGYGEDERIIVRDVFSELII